jgi:hypothetical protein
VIHAVYTEYDQMGAGIYYTQSTDNGATWSTRVPLESKALVWWYRARIKVDQMDRIHVVWEVTDAASLFETTASIHAYSVDGGQTWSKTVFAGVPVPGPSGEGPNAIYRQPAVGVDGNGVTLLVFYEAKSNRIVYSKSVDGNTWSPPEGIPGIAAGVARPFDQFDTVTDSAGHVHLVAVGYTANSDVMRLLHVEWDGQKWSKPDVVADAPPYPEYPRLALSQGNRLHVVWFVGDKPTTDRSPTGIWYSTALTSAPVQAAARAGQPTGVGSAPQSAAPAQPTPLPADVLYPAPGTTTVEVNAAGPAGLLGKLQHLPAYPLSLALVPSIMALAGVVIGRLSRGVRPARSVGKGSSEWGT